VTVAEARSFCAAVNGAVAGGEPTLTLDGRHIVHVDAVGLAALLQSTRLAEGRGVPCVVRASAALVRHCLDARLLDELRLVGDGDQAGAPHATPPRAAATDFVVARSARVVLRQAQAADVERFRQWAEDPFVEQMVGSDLLYRHRHLASDEPASIDSLVHDPRALTVVVENSGGDVLGFVRVYDVDLISRFGFVEAVVTESRSGRQGLGVEASRLLVAYAHDAMQLRRVEAKVYAYNVLSINTLRRNGFVQEGILREARLYEGQPWDIYVFSLLEPEMAEQRARGGFPDFRLLEAAS
jgi:RimJ/RimL family protein N-acetyltransferase/anti-anti-sigma regulatory factor